MTKLNQLLAQDDYCLVSVASVKAALKAEPNEIEVFTDCRKQFEDAVIKVFGETDNFLDFIENEEYSDLYNVFIPPFLTANDDECYIINRGTGEYINWYKYTHIGRDIHSTVNPNDFVTFLEEFKGEKIK